MLFGASAMMPITTPTPRRVTYSTMNMADLPPMQLHISECFTQEEVIRINLTICRFLPNLSQRVNEINKSSNHVMDTT